PEWSGYDALIGQIKSETNAAAREALMHEAEDMLMATGAVVPIYYYSDTFMQRASVRGVITNPYGFKFFHNASVTGTDTLRLCLGSEPDSLDPALNSAVDGACLISLTFGGLYRYDESGNPEPEFAIDYDVSRDGLTYTFTLRDGLKWSDGSPLTASDFVYSWKRAANTATGADYGYMFDIIRGYPNNLAVSASADGKTLTVQLNSPCAYMLDLMAFPTFYAVKRSNVEASGNWCAEPGFVTSGPFALTAWDHDNAMTYTKNPNYWDADSVKLNQLIFRLSGDDYDVFDAYENGTLDFIDTMPIDYMDELSLRADFYRFDNLGTYYFTFNVKSPMFDGKTAEQASALRRAISLLIDRRAASGMENPANSFIPAGMSDGRGGIFKRNDSAYAYPVSGGYFALSPNVEQALSLLKQAGYRVEGGKLSDETPLAFEYLINNGTGHAAIAETIRQNLAAVGIEMTVRSCAWNEFQNMTGAGNFDVARNGWIADFNDPINMLDMWVTDSGNNVCQLGR
ncbi:MAG: ABC transporter substrate-binding protein, partial [bacterium]